MHMINGNSINSINSIYLGGLDQGGAGASSINQNNHSVLLMQNSALIKSQASSGNGGGANSGRGGLAFADKLKFAYEK